jgi:hypothetical protein
MAAVTEADMATLPVADIEQPVTVLDVEANGAVPSEAKARAPRRRRGGKKDNVDVAANPDAVIDAAIPHPTESLHRHDRLEASTALPEAIETVAPAQGQKNLLPVQPHENRHQRRANSKPHHEEEAMIAGHGFGDHLPAFLRRPVRLPAGDRSTGK